MTSDEMDPLFELNWTAQQRLDGDTVLIRYFLWRLFPLLAG